MRKREEEGEGEGEGEVDWMARLNDGLPIPRFSRSDDEVRPFLLYSPSSSC